VLTRDTATGESLTLLNWRGLNASDLPGLMELYARALADDGGQPFAGDDWLLRSWYINDVEFSLAAADGDRLVGACAWRYLNTGSERRAVIVGQVAPGWRRRGLGTRLLDSAMTAVPATVPVRVDTESLTAGADALYHSRGLTCVFEEEVMTISLADAPPRGSAGADVTLTEWSGPAAARFFAVYEASFRARPGFPNWPAEEWISWISDDQDFRPDWSLLATLGDEDVGFIASAASAAGGFIEQVGVVPWARGQSIASTLITEVLDRMRAHGEARAALNVNVNNPGAMRVYRRLGFGPAGRRARYEPARLTAPWQPR